MVAKMKSGSVTVDLAAESGGNIETTVKDEKFITDNGVTCLGYTDLASRLPTTSSTLYSNNISKFLLSMGPITTKVKDHWYIDHEDPATRGMLTVENGKLMWPAPMPPPPPPTAKKHEMTEPVVIDYRRPYVEGAKQGKTTFIKNMCVLQAKRIYFIDFNSLLFQLVNWHKLHIWLAVFWPWVAFLQTLHLAPCSQLLLSQT